MRISKMWQREQSLEELHKMLKAFTKSSLDKSSKVWYNIKVAARKWGNEKSYIKYGILKIEQCTTSTKDPWNSRERQRRR